MSTSAERLGWRGDGSARSWLDDVRPSLAEAAAIGCLAIFLIWLQLGGTRAGGLIAPLVGGTTGEGAEPGMALHALTGLLLAGAVWANIVLVRLLPFRAQVAIVWIELLLLFVAFVGSFDRDLGIWF